MKVYKDGIYKTIKSDEYGVYLASGFVKVINEVKSEPIPEPEPVVEEVKVEEVVEPEVEEVTEPEPKVAPKTRRRKGG